MTMSDNELLLAIANMLDDKLDAKLDDKLKPIEKRLTKLETTLEENVIPRLQNVETTLEENVIPRLQKIEVSLEHDVTPRLQNIESCYVATYEQYQNAADRMEGVALDVELLKRVVAEHSEKLNQAISCLLYTSDAADEL